MKTVIFDFDGTIADSFAVILAIFHELTGGSKLVTPEEIVRLRHLPLREVADELRIPKWRVPFLLLRGRRKMGKRMDEVLLFGGMSETIRTLHNDGFRLLIVTSNSTENVQRFLAAHDLNEYFETVYGGVGLLAKARALRRIIKRRQLNAADCLYIGDEPRDIDAARKASIDCIAAAWGFNAPQLLAQHEPYAIAQEPETLPEVVRRWQKAPRQK